MPLQQLVEYFNDRLEQEHSNGFRPFTLQDSTVKAQFGPIRLASTLLPIRQTLATATISGHIAQLEIATAHHQPLQDSELPYLLHDQPNTDNGNTAAIINFDRLSRTVHMLNYLPLTHLGDILFLDVDPRHILGIKEDHGAYFEEIIVKCGLQTQHVAIGLTLEQVHARFFPAFLKGLHNYQRRGYRLALKFNGYALEKPVFELIEKIAPDFVGISAQGLEQIQDASTFGKIQQLNSLTASIEARSLLLHVEDKFQAELARKAGFNLVQGDYFEQAITSVNRPDTRLSSASRMSNAHW